jgi:hypothetical protein
MFAAVILALTCAQSPADDPLRQEAIRRGLPLVHFQGVKPVAGEWVIEYDPQPMPFLLGHYWMSIPDERGRLQHHGWYGSIDQVRCAIQAEHRRRSFRWRHGQTIEPEVIEELLKVFPKRLP